MTHSVDRRARAPRGTRERLVQAALELFTSDGYHSSTTPRIAAKAGIAEGTIYRHFDSKEHLFNEIFRAAVRLLADPVTASDASEHCRDRLSRTAAEWCEVARANPALIKLVFATDKERLLDSHSEALFEDLLQGLEKIVVAGKSAGHVRAGSARIWTDVWLRLVVLVLERTASGQWPPDHPAPQQVLESAWDAIGATGN